MEDLRKEKLRHLKLLFTNEERRLYRDLRKIILKASKSEDHSPRELEEYLSNVKLSSNVATAINTLYNTKLLEVKEI